MRLGLVGGLGSFTDAPKRGAKRASDREYSIKAGKMLRDDSHNGKQGRPTPLVPSCSRSFMMPASSLHIPFNRWTEPAVSLLHTRDELFPPDAERVAGSELSQLSPSGARWTQPNAGKHAALRGLRLGARYDVCETNPSHLFITPRTDLFLGRFPSFLLPQPASSSLFLPPFPFPLPSSLFPAQTASS